MAQRDLFAERFDAAAAVVRQTRRWPGPAPVAAARFSYPELDAPALPPAPPAAVPEAPAPTPTFSEADLARALAAARRDAWVEAETALRAELAASLEQREAEALGTIAAQLAAAGAALEQALAARAGACRELALALARALVPRALALQPLADIEAMLQSLMLRLDREPRLEVGLPPALTTAGEAVLGRLAAATGYRGELTVVAEPGLGPGDASVRWRDGAAERDLARIEAEAVALVESWLPHDDHQAQDAPAQPETARTKEGET
jgi:flagellar biosynthesis/type III secretory pathway protein FliH